MLLPLIFGLANTDLFSPKDGELPGWAYRVKLQSNPSYIDNRQYKQDLPRWHATYPKFSSSELFGDRFLAGMEWFAKSKDQDAYDSDISEYQNFGGRLVCGDTLSANQIDNADKKESDSSGRTIFTFQKKPHFIKTLTIDKRNRLVGWSVIYQTKDSIGLYQKSMMLSIVTKLSAPTISERLDKFMVSIWEWSKGAKLTLLTSDMRDDGYYGIVCSFTID